LNSYWHLSNTKASSSSSSKTKSPGLKINHPGRLLNPVVLENQKNTRQNLRGINGPGSKKRSKTAQLQIHRTDPIEPDEIPTGSQFRYYKDFVVQDIVIHPCNTRFRLKVYETPDGGYVTGTLPAYLNGKHFGPTLIRFILYQYYHCHVTQPLLLEQLYEFGIDISAGQLNNLLIEEKERFHQEKDRILSVGLEVSAYINVDDTGARHQGKNGYCTHIGNESFSWFESTGSKSRINFLKLMRAGHSDFAITMDAVCYMQSNKLPQKILDVINDNLGTSLSDLTTPTLWLGFIISWRAFNILPIPYDKSVSHTKTVE
jgi:hypothetical protein